MSAAGRKKVPTAAHSRLGRERSFIDAGRLQQSTQKAAGVEDVQVRDLRGTEEKYYKTSEGKGSGGSERKRKVSKRTPPVSERSRCGDGR